MTKAPSTRKKIIWKLFLFPQNSVALKAIKINKANEIKPFNASRIIANSPTNKTAHQTQGNPLNIIKMYSYQFRLFKFVLDAFNKPLEATFRFILSNKVILIAFLMFSVALILLANVILCLILKKR